MSLSVDPNARPVIFGECLFDHYPDGSRVFGGAPLAVAWHLQGFGLRPLFITRIGQDTQGELALAAMHQWGLDTRAMQIDQRYPTGNVQVTKEGSENHFEIKPDQAWDHITAHLALEWIKSLPCSLLYAGTLAQRNEISYRTLQRLITETKLPLFMDINIREPWNKANIIEKSLCDAHWLKVNEHELATLRQEQLKTTDDIILSAKKLKNHYDVTTLYVTRGDKGALLLKGTHCISDTVEPKITASDTVGAGDAFTAVCILGIHHQWSDEITLERANQFAAMICQVPGATSLTKQDYTELANQWM